MLGAPCLRTTVDASRVKPMTNKMIRKALGSCERDADARHFLEVMVDQSLKPLIEGILEYADVDANLSGGTMGAPRFVEAVAFVLKDKLGDALVSLGGVYFLPPYSRAEIARRQLHDWLWKTVADNERALTDVTSPQGSLLIQRPSAPAAICPSSRWRACD